MKGSFHKILIYIVLTLSVSFSIGFAADKKPYPTSPPAKVTKKWRIGYYEGGFYKDYPKTVIATIRSLSELGWIEPLTIPWQENEKDTRKLWAWLAGNVKSRYLEFVPDAYYSINWKNDIREQTKQTIIKRLKESEDIDMMLALGTWAGQDLANAQLSVPTIVCSVSDPVSSKIVLNAEDSGSDYIHALVDPKKPARQICSFHDVIGFKKVGVSYIDTVAGRSYAYIEELRKIAKERKFEIAECHVPDGGATPEANAKVIECAKMLAPKIDAFYLTTMGCVNKETLPQIISAMNAAKIPVFSQSGSDEVRHGALMSISSASSKDAYGKFHAEVMAKVINGAKPRDLDMLCEAPPKIAFNKAAAKIIDLRDDVYQLLSKTAQEVYDKVEVSR